jgi:hypothetical protein
MAVHRKENPRCEPTSFAPQSSRAGTDGTGPTRFGGVFSSHLAAVNKFRQMSAGRGSAVIGRI